MNHEQMAAHLAATWGRKTLNAFRAEAAREMNGTVYETLRIEAGPRLVLVICVTGPHEINKLQKYVNLEEGGTPADWARVTLGELVMKVVMAGSVSYEAQRDTENRLTAVLLIMAEPRSIRSFEHWLNLPP